MPWWQINPSLYHLLPSRDHTRHILINSNRHTSWLTLTISSLWGPTSLANVSCKMAYPSTLMCHPNPCLPDSFKLYPVQSSTWLGLEQLIDVTGHQRDDLVHDCVILYMCTVSGPRANKSYKWTGQMCPWSTCASWPTTGTVLKSATHR